MNESIREDQIEKVESLRKPKHNKYHDNKLGCWECLEEREYNEAIDDVIDMLKKYEGLPS